MSREFEDDRPPRSRLDEHIERRTGHETERPDYGSERPGYEPERQAGRPRFDEERAQRIRQARQVLSGSEVRKPDGPLDYGAGEALVNPTQRIYLLVLAVLLAISLILYFALGPGWASPFLFILGLALLAGWVIF